MFYKFIYNLSRLHVYLIILILLRSLKRCDQKECNKMGKKKSKKKYGGERKEKNEDSEWKRKKWKIKKGD